MGFLEMRLGHLHLPVEQNVRKCEQYMCGQGICAADHACLPGHSQHSTAYSWANSTALRTKHSRFNFSWIYQHLVVHPCRLLGVSLRTRLIRHGENWSSQLQNMKPRGRTCQGLRPEPGMRQLSKLAKQSLIHIQELAPSQSRP
jgi:hypothetical protein